MEYINYITNELITDFDLPVALKARDVENLFSNINSGIGWASISDFTDFVSSFRFYPLKHSIVSSPTYETSYLTLNSFGNAASAPEITFNRTDKEVSAGTIRKDAYRGFYLAEFNRSNLENNADFTDYEPYRILRLYLPYLGFVTVDYKLWEPYRYLQVLLFIDFRTGNAKYVLSTSPVSIPIQGNNYIPENINSYVSYIMSEHNFKLGCDINIGTNNSASNIRNLALSAVQTVGSVALAVATSGTSLAATTATVATTTTATNTTKARNPKTGRLRTESKGTTTLNEETTKNTDYSGSIIRNSINECFSYGVNALQNFVMRPTSNTVQGDGTSLSCGRDIYLLEERCKIKNIDDNFKHLYGLPLGQSVKLSSLSGYTLISQIHLEGNGFASANLQEINMIEELLSKGFII